MNDEPDGSGHREVLSALNTVEARRRIYFEKNLAGIYACTLSCDFLECNESFARMLGYASPTDVLSINGRALYLHVEDHDRLMEELQENGSVTNRELRLKKRDGETIWVIANISLIPAEELGAPIIKGSVVDISDRRAAEEALRRSEERFRIVARATNDAVWDWDLLTDGVWWNDGFRTLFGYRDEEIAPDSTSWTDRIHPDDRERVESGIRALIASGRQA